MKRILGAIVGLTLLAGCGSPKSFSGPIHSDDVVYSRHPRTLFVQGENGDRSRYYFFPFTDHKVSGVIFEEGGEIDYCVQLNCDPWFQTQAFEYVDTIREIQ